MLSLIAKRKNENKSLDYEIPASDVMAIEQSSLAGKVIIHTKSETTYKAYSALYADLINDIETLKALRLISDGFIE